MNMDASVTEVEQNKAPGVEVGKNTSNQSAELELNTGADLQAGCGEHDGLRTHLLVAVVVHCLPE